LNSILYFRPFDKYSKTENNMVRLAAIGEVMVELSPYPVKKTEPNTPELMAISFGGDTYNTSVYLSRLGIQIQYISNLGDDPYSQLVLKRMVDENIDTQVIQCLTGRSLGLYTIRNKQDGEREFFYWRNESPARELFSTSESSEILFEKLKDKECIYLSGITLAIISASARENLIAVLKRLKKLNIILAFDSNYRPRLWRDIKEAQAAILQLMQITDIALLTLDDEYLLWGDNGIQACKQRYQHFNLRELILKRGAQDVVVLSTQTQTNIPVPAVPKVVDTTGAGDSFNAGYLAARLQGATIDDAVEKAIRCAAIVIGVRGAIVDKCVFDREIKCAYTR
jgi:2-dehydro-3-deoxygluconokinase